MNLSNEEKLILGMTAIAFLAAFWIGASLASGVFAGLLSSLGTFMLFSKLKEFSPAVWRFLVKRSLLLDMLLSGVSAWLVASSTVTGIIAMASAGLISSAMITIAQKQGVLEVSSKLLRNSTKAGFFA